MDKSEQAKPEFILSKQLTAMYHLPHQNQPVHKLKTTADNFLPKPVFYTYSSQRQNSGDNFRQNKNLNLAPLRNICLNPFSKAKAASVMNHHKNKLKAFVIGNPIQHSKSPLIHNFWIEQHHVNASYEAIEVKTASLDLFLARLRKGEFIGGNVTIPHKQQVMHKCDLLSRSASAIGAVNTLYLSGEKISGSNSDHFGFVDNLDQQKPGWAHNMPKAIILGAGGAARAIVYAMVQRQIPNIMVLNRTLSSATTLAEEFGPTVRADRLSSFANHAPDTQLLVNTTSVGLGGTAFDHLALEKLPKTALVHDIVYTPLLTPLLAQAHDLGLETLDGLGMLLHQAIPGFERWFGIRPEVTQNLRQLIEQEILQQ